MPFPFKSRFTHVMTHLHPRGPDALRILRAECDKRICEILKRSEPFDELALSMLGCFPEIAYALAPQIRKSPGALEAIAQDPNVLYNVVIGDYPNSKDLEVRLLGEGQGEIIFRLLSWAKLNKVTLHRAIDVYEEWIARDPFWAGQYIVSHPESRNIGVSVECFARAYRKEDSAAAFAWIALHPEESLSPYNSVILQNPFYSYLSLTFPERLDTLCLQRRNLTPRWAYHLAVHGSTGQQSLLEDVLMDDIGWLVEYLVDAELCYNEPQRVSELYVSAVRRMVAQRRSHVCLTSMHAWVTRLTAYHKAKASAKSQVEQGATC